MKIASATFVRSSTDVKDCPSDDLPEYAFIGRSNVGKSSLINMLLGRKKLAKTSGTPGKTQLINHFLVNENWYLVDLPGYGYARASKKSIKKFQAYITKYFLERKQLLCAFVLVDIRHEPQQIDREFMVWLTENQVPLVLVFTKADKLSARAAEEHIAAYLRIMLENEWEEAPPYFVTSSLKKRGREEILDYIASVNAAFKDSR